MHVYIYESGLDGGKQQALIAKIETRITDLGLSGKIIRLNPMHNLQKTINDEAKAGRTIVFVGSDKLFSEGLSVLAYKDVSVGYIPLFDKQPLALALGLPKDVNACDVLAARRIQKIDLGLANGHSFLGELTLTSVHSLVDIDNNIHIEVGSENKIRVINLLINQATDHISDPTDGLLELVITTKTSIGFLKKNQLSTSYFQNDRFTINADVTAQLDRANEIATPINIEIAPKALDLIVGKERHF